MPYILKVGERYPLSDPDPNAKPPEGIRWMYSEGQHGLCAVLPRLIKSEVRSWQHDRFEFALYCEDGVIFVLWRVLGGIWVWGDCPFSIHLVPPEVRTHGKTAVEMGLEEPHQAVVCTLISLEDGVLRALRYGTWSPAFTAAMVVAIRDQEQRPFDPSTYNDKIARIRARLSPDEMVKLAHVRTHLGA